MPQGFTDFRFHGGPFDGQVHGDSPSIYARDKIAYFFQGHFSWRDGKIRLIKPNDGRLSKDWFLTFKAIYEKSDKPTQPTGVDYRFVELASHRRCLAVTKKGELCRNAAAPGSHLCETSHKKASGTVTLTQDPFLLEELLQFDEDGYEGAIGMLEDLEAQEALNES
jgi:hypothetical protein